MRVSWWEVLDDKRSHLDMEIRFSIRLKESVRGYIVGATKANGNMDSSNIKW